MKGSSIFGTQLIMRGRLKADAAHHGRQVINGRKEHWSRSRDGRKEHWSRFREAPSALVRRKVDSIGISVGNESCFSSPSLNDNNISNTMDDDRETTKRMEARCCGSYEK
ncbi:unnamed protein product [Heligmosomoides polygyrus]|uniref:Uncharacterized protein n=1 Tax=Heligmosomoides polygyrus TaxID=6339 RepID=A0A183F3Q1_HELPZ|nr:unnamed protein product [Heligmosomoides polygyrus]